MSIEEDIKQKEFANIYEKVAISIMVTNNWYVGRVKVALREFEISPEQYNVLRILKGADVRPVTMKYIKDRMIDKGSNVTRLIDKMERKKWVTRCLCEDNRRQMDIDITNEGIELLKELNVVIADLVKVLESLNKTESEQLIGLLNKIRG